MKKPYLLILFIIASLVAQPKEQIEFQLNTISGVIFNSSNSKPLMDLKVEILAGNNILKDSTFTDENGYYKIDNVGFVWKPKMRFSLHNFQEKVLKLFPEKLDSLNNIVIGEIINPVPEEDQQEVWIPTKEDLAYQDSMFHIVDQTSRDLDTIRKDIDLIIYKLDRLEYKDGSYDSIRYVEGSKIDKKLNQ